MDQKQRHFPVVPEPIRLGYEAHESSSQGGNQALYSAYVINNGESSTAPKPYEIQLDPLVFAFSEQSVRRAFARKVFAILSLILLKTTAYIAVCVYVPAVKEFWQSNVQYIFVALPIYIITCILIFCIKSARRTFPINYIILLIFSSSVTYMVGGLCSLYDQDTVMIAFGLTAVLCLTLIIFACQTKWDITACGMFLFSLIIILLMVSVMSLVWMSRAAEIWFCCLGIVIFSIFLIYDVQLIISGNHSMKISPEEHIFAVTVLYLDIINIFLRMLRVLK